MCSETVLFCSKGYCNLNTQLLRSTATALNQYNASGLNSGLQSCFDSALMTELDKPVNHYCSTEIEVITVVLKLKPPEMSCER